MNKKVIKKVAVFIGLAAIILFAFASPIFAFTTRGGNNITISENVEDDLYIGGSTIIVSSEIDGDLIASGGRLTVDGNVSEDLTAAGGFIDLSGQVGDDIRAAGGMVTINGPVSDDLIAAGGTIKITGTSKVGGDIVVTGGDIIVDGEVSGNLNASGGNITISGKIGQDVNIDGVEKLVIGSTAEINGDLVYESSQKAEIADGAKIGGEVKFTEIKEVTRTKQQAPMGVFGWFFGATYIISMIVSFLSLFVVGIILLKVIPVIFAKFNDRMKSTVGLCAGAGAINIFGVPIGILIAWIIALILLLTALGAGIATLIFATSVISIVLYLVLIYVSSIFISYLIGELILSSSKLDINKYGVRVLAYLIGLIIITAVGAIPFLGGIITFAVILFGVGGLSMLIWDWMRQTKMARR